MKKITPIILLISLLFVSSEGVCQDNRTFWQKIFGKGKSEKVNVEEPKNSTDSLAVLLNNHLSEPEVKEDVVETPVVDPFEDADTNVISNNPHTSGIGSVSFEIDPKVSAYLDTVTSVQVYGFRIQVFTGDYTEARQIRSSLLNNGERATIAYNVSDYTVRIGDYRSYMSAQEKLAVIRRTYPGAYVVKDKVKI